MRPARRVTMQDVADRAQVSKSAVSLAFNDASKLSDATLRHILQAADELGYSQDPAGRMLRTRRTGSLGLLLPQELERVFENPYNSLFLQGLGQVCQREGYTLLLAPPLRGSVLKTIPFAAVDGFVVAGLEYDRGEVRALRRRNIPFVLVDSEWHKDVPSVDVDDAEGIRDVVTHLAYHGHGRIAFAVIETGIEGGIANWRGPVHRRMQGAVEALSAAGLPAASEDLRVVEVPCTRAGGAQAFQALWVGDTKPTAIVAFSDIIAFGLLDAAREAGVNVPGELSISGFDDLTESSWTMPTLTTVRQPIATKGRLAAEYLVDAIASTTDDHPRQHRLSTTLLLRESTGPAPRRGRKHAAFADELAR